MLLAGETLSVTVNSFSKSPKLAFSSLKNCVELGPTTFGGVVSFPTVAATTLTVIVLLLTLPAASIALNR